MKPGPPRQPTKILQLRDSQYAKRPQEPQAQALSSRAPDWLDADAKKLWRTYLRRFQGVGILTQLDQTSFARYCQTLAVWLKMEAFRQKHGEVYPIRGLNNEVKGFAIFPQMGLYLRLSEQLCKMEQQFGLTPASRASLVTQKDVPAHGNSDEARKAQYFA